MTASHLEFSFPDDAQSHMYYFILYPPKYFWGFPSHSRIFHSYVDVTITIKRLQIWPMLGT